MSSRVTILIPTRDGEFDLPVAIAAGLEAGRVLVADAGSRDGSAILLRQLEALYPALACIRGTALDALGRIATRYVLLAPVEQVLVPANVALLVESASATGAAIAYGNVIHSDGTITGNESVQPSVFERDAIPDVLLIDREQMTDFDVRAALCRGLRAVFVPTVTAFAPPRRVRTPELPEPAVRQRWPLASRHLRYSSSTGQL